MGICSYKFCRIKQFIPEKDEYIFNEIFLGLKLSQISFNDIFKYLFEEVISNDGKIIVDKSKRMNKSKFLSIAKRYFYEEDVKKNQYSLYHSLMFQYIAKVCLNRWDIDQVECWKVMIIILSLLRGEKERKIEYFLQISNDYLSPDLDDKISSLRLGKLIRFYLEYTLVFFTKLIYNINQSVCRENNFPGIRKRLNIFSDFNNMTIFLTMISPYLNPAHEETLLSFEETKSILKKWSFIFNFFELRDNFLSMIKERPDNKEQRNSFNFTYSDLEEEVF